MSHSFPRRAFLAGAAACVALAAGTPASAAEIQDWLTGSPRTTLPVKAWPNGKKVAVCFVLYVEEWGQGRGPNLRPDMVSRDPDVVDESFRRYAIDWGVPRVGRLFAEQKLPLSVALNAYFPSRHAAAWKSFREAMPAAAIVGHGLNNTSELLPLARGRDAQVAYIRKTLDLIEKDTGVRPKGWSSPSVFPNGDTFAASAAAGITYTLDSMDSDVLSRLDTSAGPLVLIPYPAVTVDMGHYLERNQQPGDLARLWIDYIGELSREAAMYPDRDATVVAIGVHPFVVGTPDGAAALRRVLEHAKGLGNVWIADTDAVMAAAPR